MGGVHYLHPRLSGVQILWGAASAELSSLSRLLGVAWRVAGLVA